MVVAEPEPQKLPHGKIPLREFYRVAGKIEFKIE
jgi:hypothetical protein